MKRSTLVPVAASLFAAIILSLIVPTTAHARKKPKPVEVVITVNVPEDTILVYKDQYGNTLKKRAKRAEIVRMINTDDYVVDPMEHVSTRSNYEQRASGFNGGITAIGSRNGLEAVGVTLGFGNQKFSSNSSVNSNIPGYYNGAMYGGVPTYGVALVPIQVIFFSEATWGKPVEINVYSDMDKRVLLGRVSVLGYGTSQVMLLPPGHYWLQQEGTGGNWFDVSPGMKPVHVQQS